MDIGSRVKDARKAANLSQEELARRAGVPLNRVGRIETGVVTDPHYSTLESIARGLDMQVGELLEEAVPLGEAGPLSPPPSFEVPIPNSMQEALDLVGAPTRLLALPRDKFEELYTNASAEEVGELSRDFMRERQLLKPILNQWTTMKTGSKEQSRLYALWQESFTRWLTATDAAARTGDTETAQLLVEAA